MSLAPHGAVLGALCKRHGVVRLEAFGSALRSAYDARTGDIDFLVELGPMEPYERVDAYFGLLEDLREQLGTRIHLVMMGAVRNRFIAQDIEQTKRLVYSA